VLKPQSADGLIAASVPVAALDAKADAKAARPPDSHLNDARDKQCLASLAVAGRAAMKGVLKCHKSPITLYMVYTQTHLGDRHCWLAHL
jgi:hypothetical protein